VRSHAKASSVGSNSGRGTSRRSLRRSGTLAALLVALMAAACLLPGSAFAVERRSVVESFGPDGTSGTSFERPEKLAFDSGNNRLYALDAAAQKIHGYSAPGAGTHTPLGGSFPLTAPGAGEFDDIGVDSSSHDLYFASVGENSLYGFDESGAALSGFPVTGQNFSCGAATDSAGNIWVAEGNEGKLRKYSPAGALLETITIGGEPCDLAIDSQNNIYVAFFEGSTYKYTAASNYTASTQLDGETSNAVAVDPSTDEVYVAHFSHISVYEADGTFLYEFGKAVATEEGKFTGVAVDPSTEQVYASSNAEKKVLVFGTPLLLPKVVTGGADNITATGATVHGTVNPQGEALTDCHFEVVPGSQFEASAYTAVTAAEEFPCAPAAGSIPADSSNHAVSAELSGLSPATFYHYRLRATSSIGETLGTDRVFVSGPVAPLVEAQSVTAIGTNDAIVSAKINPNGGDTTYHVEYGTTGSYGQSTAESAPIGAPADTSYHTVSVHIAGLQIGTAYHFRFVATNEAGSGEGPDTSFFTYPTINPTFAPCPNDAFRVGPGARLPDCRAYERATPAEKHGANARGLMGLVEASSSGDRVDFFANGGLPTTGGSASLYPFIATRGPEGWNSDGITPLTSPGFGAYVIGWDEDLTTVFGAENVDEEFFKSAYYLRDSNTATFRRSPTVDTYLGSLGASHLSGFALDHDHLMFEYSGRLTPDAPDSVTNLYDLDHGIFTFVGRVPAGAATSCDDESGPACIPAPEGSFGGAYEWERAELKFGGTGVNTISRDGSRAFFTTRNVGQLYVRQDGARTMQVSASQRTVPDPSGTKPAAFIAATPDGSQVIFLSCEKLTDDSTAVSTGENRCHTSLLGQQSEQGQDLYSYDVDTGELTDLTVDSNPDPLGANVQGVLGTSEDFSYIYFAASGVLAPGASSAACSGSSGCNLYVYHEGTIKFIGRADGNLQASDAWTAEPVGNGAAEGRTSRVSADGHTLVFRSRQKLTGYDNTPTTPAACGESPCNEFYRYSAPEEALTCISCDPAGTRPEGEAGLGNTQPIGLHGNTSFTFLTRNLSTDGNRFFFDTDDSLLPSDVNGVTDVYEWEAKSEGSCESERLNGGCLYLLSPGNGPKRSFFGDASANGDHVFIFTTQQLVPSDEDELYDVYDVGVGAGLAAQHALTPPTCATTACQANPAPPPEQTPASATFKGPGNFRAQAKGRKCPKGTRKMHRKGKAGCQKARKQHKRHHNRGGSK
jgi:hypothetical protein